MSELRTGMKAWALAQPLRNKGAEYYGFVEGIHEQLQRHSGSGVDPGQLELKNRFPREPFQMHERYLGTADPNPWALPGNIRLWVGFMPIPETLVPDGYEDDRPEMLSALAAYFQADAALFDLPASLPNGFFASVAHLNPKGRSYFTRQLADVLAGFLNSQPSALGMSEISPAK